jgi:hypothetical protein
VLDHQPIPPCTLVINNDQSDVESEVTYTKGAMAQARDKLLSPALSGHAWLREWNGCPHFHIDLQLPATTT